MLTTKASAADIQSAQLVSKLQYAGQYTYTNVISKNDASRNAEIDVKTSSEISPGIAHVLDHEIMSGRRQVEQTLHSDRSKFDLLDTLAQMLLERYTARKRPQDLDDAIALRREAVKITPPSHPLLHGALEMLGYTLIVRKNATGRQEDLNEAIDVRKQALNLDMSAHDHKPAVFNLKILILNNLGENLKTRFKREGKYSDLNEAIALFKRALKLQHKPDERRIWTLSELMAVLHDHFTITKDISDLTDSIPLFDELMVLQVPPDPHEHRSSFLNYLATSFQAEFEQNGGKHYLEKSIELHRQALKNIPDPHPFRSRCLYSLATALHLQSVHQVYSSKYLEEAIQLHRQALQFRPYPHPDRANSLDSLATALLSQFRYSGEVETQHLDEAIELLKQALRLVHHSDPDYAVFLNNLALALETRFEHGGKMTQLEEAIKSHRQSLQLAPHPHPSHIILSVNLAKSLQLLFEHSSVLRHLEEAIELYKQALQYMPEPYSGQRSTCLNNMAAALVTRFEHVGTSDSTHLEDVVELQRQALRFRPNPHPDRSNSLNGLAATLHAQFEHDGGLTRLEEAIELYKEALVLRLHPDPDRSTSLVNLARALESRFMHGGALNYIKEAIAMYRDALQYTQNSHPQYSISLTNLANALFKQFHHDSRFDYLDEATEMYREVLRLRHSETHSRHADSLNNLAAALHVQYNRKGELTHLDEAIELHKQVVALRPSPHPARHSSLSNLAASLYNRFEHDDEFVHFENAISLLQSELKFTPKDCSFTSLTQSIAHIPQLQHSHHHILAALSRLYIKAYESLGSEHFLECAISTIVIALRCLDLSPFQRFKFAMLWAENADRYQHPSAMDSYDFIVQLLPELTSLGHSLNQRQKDMVTHSGIQATAHNASQYAIRVQRFDKAIEYLEAARTLLWSQIFRLRPPFEQLSLVAPELGKRLKEIAEELDQASHIDSVPVLNISNSMPESDKRAFRLANLTVEWQTKLDEVRKIEGFKDYLLPRRMSSLQGAAHVCPIALLVPHSEASTCLVITPTAMHHIAIPAFTTSKLRKMVIDIQRAAISTSRAPPHTQEEASAYDPEDTALEALLDDGNNGRLTASRKGVRGVQPDDVFRTVLAELWKELVEPVINALRIKVGFIFLLLSETLTLMKCAEIIW